MQNYPILVVLNMEVVRGLHVCVCVFVSKNGARECMSVFMCGGKSQVTPSSFPRILQYITVTANVASFQIV